jgi:hypothetical protein
MDGSTVTPAPIQVCQNWVYFLVMFRLFKFASCADQVSNLCSHNICFSINLGQKGVQRIATLHGI